MDDEHRKRYPARPKDYKLYEEVGTGVSATVYRALCIPLNEIVAIKVLDLERCNNDLDGIRREVQTMSLIDHPNVLRAYCSFPSESSLWVVMPYMAGGSCLHIMKSAYPDGFEESVIATVLQEVLKALVYLHGQGHIHRDVKSGNILIDANGSVKLADFGVSACMFDTGDRQRSRNTFVGTPCWMAPEVMQQLHGYDFKADIWSFGITALELAHGHAPFSKYPPMKVLLMTLQNAPPGLDYERDKKFSKSFRDLVAACLAKDPKKRPSSEKLLRHSFFKHGRSNEFLLRTVLDGLPPLGDRFRVLKERESDMLLQNKALNEDKEQLSQQQYIRGISAWNFNLEELKAQAALIQPLDEISSTNDGFHISKDDCVDVGVSMVDENRLDDVQDLEGPFSSAFSSCPLEALKTCFDVCEDDNVAISPDCKDQMPLNSENNCLDAQRFQDSELATTKINGENLQKVSVSKDLNSFGCHKFTNALKAELIPLHSSNIPLDEEWIHLHQKYPHGRNFSGPLPHRQIRDIPNHPPVAHDDLSEGKVVQQRGRFRVTSAEANSKVAALSAKHAVSQVGFGVHPVLNMGSVLPSLQFLLQQNSLQREQLATLIKHVEQATGNASGLTSVGAGDSAELFLTSSRESLMHSYINQLHQSVSCLSEEVQKLKLKNAQLERQINALATSKLAKEGTSGSGAVD